VFSLCYVAEVRWKLGYPEQALNKSLETLSLARTVSHPPSLAEALTYTARIHQVRGEGRAVQEHAEAVRTLTTEQGFPFWLAWGTMLQGWALIQQGQREEGIKQIREGLVAYRATASGAWQSEFLGLLAEAYGQDGQTENGLKTVDEALAFVERTNERYYEAELWRIKGELTLAQSSVPSLASSATSTTHSEAETYFFKAIEVAQKQQAKSWELHASTNLRGCGSNKASHTQHATCCLTCTTGSPKGLTPRTCRRRKRYWRSWPDRFPLTDRHELA
jgi:predicted ATPase